MNTKKKKYDRNLKEFASNNILYNQRNDFFIYFLLYSIFYKYLLQLSKHATYCQKTLKAEA